MESGGHIKADLVQKALILALSLISVGGCGLFWRVRKMRVQ